MKTLMKRFVLRFMILFIFLAVTVTTIALIGTNTINIQKVVEAVKIKKEARNTFNLTLKEMYCNMKDTRSIARVQTTVEVKDKKLFREMEDKSFLIRDEINKIIRDKKATELQGEEGMINLQEEIRERMIEIFDGKGMIDIYFDDFIMQ